MSDAHGISAHARARLDLVRGLAALAVFIGHGRHIFIATTPGAGVLGRGLYWLTSLGHPAVLAFFVLSGFLITDSVLTSPGWRRYAVARTSRVLTVYLPALALGVALDLAGMQLFGRVGIYAPDNPVWPDFPRFISATIAAQNVVFLQGIRAQILGSNLPIWTLAYEAWFYVAFPFVWEVLEGPKRTRVFSVLALLVVGAIVGPTVVAAFPVWLLGAALATARRRQLRRTSKLAAAAALAALYGVLAVHVDARPFVARDLLTGAVMLGVVALAAGARGAASVAFARVAGALSAVSYSLYLTHAPMLVFLAAALAVPPQWVLSASSLLRLAGVLAITFLYAVVVWFAIERRTPRVRAWLGGRRASRA